MCVLKRPISLLAWLQPKGFVGLAHYVQSLLFIWASGAMGQSSPHTATLLLEPFQSRALLTCSPTAPTVDATLVIMLPGAGFLGPQSWVPSQMHTTGRGAHPLFLPLAQALQDAGFHTFQLGQPGVEKGSPSSHQNPFYNTSLFFNHTLAHAITNVYSAVDLVAHLSLCGAKKVVLLGHGEGGALAVRAAAKDGRVGGLVLLGLPNSNLPPLANWRGALFHLWGMGAQTPVYTQDLWAKPDIATQGAALNIPLLAFTGVEDLQTPTSQLLDLSRACQRAQNPHCHVWAVARVGHCFSNPLNGGCGPMESYAVRALIKKMKQWSLTVVPHD